MTANQMTIPVLAASNWSPDAARTELDAPYGLTVQQIVLLALPGANAVELAHVRVSLVRGDQISAIDPQYWHCAKPNADVRVVIRLMPAKDALRSILSIVVTIAAVALGGVWGAALGTFLGASTAVGTALVVAGVTLLGNLLVNALIPPVQADNSRQNTYSITGIKNRAVPNGAVPVVLGKMRVAPPFAALPYTEIVGDDQYIRALFVVGEGEVAIDDMRIGDTSLSEYSHVEIEVRNGVEGELPVSLYPHQVVEEQIGVELTRPLQRDDHGNAIDDTPAIETPIVRTTGADASGAAVLLAFPSGLVKFNNDGNKQSNSVTVRIEQRSVEADEWQFVKSLNINAKKVEGFYRQYAWQFPTRGRWQVRCTMMTKESDSSKRTQRTTWAALQTLRPEYPLNVPRPLALVALRIKATHQLSGALDNFSCLVSRVCLDWDSATGGWIKRATENPASLYRHVLQDPANAYPIHDAKLDLDLLQHWHEFCTARSLTFNKALSETSTTMNDVLAEVTAAGRASPRHDGRQYGVVIDEPTEDGLIIDEINPRNSWNFSTRRPYFDPPHATVVNFLDAANDYKPTQRQVRWPGYEGDIEITEELPLSGKVYADEVWREARRAQLSALYRPDTFTATQDGRFRIATRGDHVMVSHYTLSQDQYAARVTNTVGALIELDELVTMDLGEKYAIRFRHFENANDVIGASVVRIVKTDPGETSLLQLIGTGPEPRGPRRENGLRIDGDMIQFGKSNTTAYRHIVRNVETTADDASIFSTIAMAPEIDTELDATVVPAWSSRVGTEIDDNLLQPSPPRFSSVSSGISGTGTANQIVYLIEAGSGSVATTSFEIQHRLTGDTDWTTTTIAAANGGGTLVGYQTADAVEIRARGVSSTGAKSPFTAIISLLTGAGDAGIPSALDDAGVSVTPLLGGALIQIATGDDTATTALQVYRSTSPVLDRATDATGQPLAVEPQSSYSTALGDTTRPNLVSGGTMTYADAWTLGAGWAIAGGVAAHTAGTADGIAQSLGATAGKHYRIGFAVAGLTAGTLTPRLTGGSVRPGTSITANGTYSDRIQAVSGNDTLEFLANTEFDGTLDGVSAYLETSGCLAQGTHFIWIEPQNADGLPGPISGPFQLNII